MYFKKNVTYFVILLIFHPFLINVGKCLQHNYVECEQISNCDCLFPDGNGINFKQIFNTTVMSINVNSTSVLHFNLCYDTVSLDGECKNVSFCLVNKSKGNNSTYKNFGYAKYNKIQWNRISDVPQIKNENGSVIVSFTCNKGAMVNPTIHNNSNKNDIIDLSIVWTSESCPSLLYSTDTYTGVSLFGVLILFTLILFLLYCIFGVFVLKFIQGATGTEMIPNHDFWLSLHEKCLNGFKFLLNGCKSPATYDTI